MYTIKNDKLFPAALAYSVTLLLSFTATAQINFSVLMRGDSTDYGWNPILSNDSSYLIPGYMYNKNDGSKEDMLLVKLNKNGNLMWSKVMGGTDWDNGSAVVQTTDSGYALAGNTSSFGLATRDAFLVKMDKNGVVQWSKTYGGAGYDSFYALTQTNDGGYILAGEYNSDAYIVKTDGAGTVQWSKSYQGSGQETIIALSQTFDNGYIFTGFTSSFGAGFDDIFLLKTDSLGTTKWVNMFGGFKYDHPGQIVQTADSGFAIGGYTDSYGQGYQDAYLLKTDSAGNKLWSRTYGGSYSDFGFSLGLEPDRGFILGGTASFFIGQGSDAYLIKTDSSGNHIWSKTYGGTLSESFAGAVRSYDNGYFIGGYGGNPLAGVNDLFAMKTDYKTDILCQDSTPPTITGTPTESISIPAFSENILVSVGTAQTISIFSWIHSDSAVCRDTSFCPVASFSADTVCPGDSTHFINSSIEPNGLNITKWIWVYGDGNSDTLTTAVNPAHLYAGGGIFAVKLIVMNDAIPVCTDSIIMNVEVYSLTFTAGADDSLCPGENVQLNASGGTTYLWSPSSGLNNPNISNPIANPTGITNYVVTITDTNGCSAKDSLIVKVLSNPIISIGGDTTICEGQNTTLTASASGGINYSWSPSSGLNNPNISNPIASPPADTTTYVVTVSDANGCAGKDSLIVIVVATPTVSITGNITICEGKNTTITASGGTTYSWNTGNTNTSIMINPTTNTTYTVTAMIGACFATATTTVMVNATPSAPSASSNSPVNAGGNLSLSASTITGATYYWTGPNAYSSVSQNPVITNITTNEAGCYTVTVTQNSCTVPSDTTCVTVTPLTGIYEPDLSGAITIFPNPTSGQLTIQMNNGSTSTIEVYNVVGEKVYSSTINSRTSIIKIDEPDGIYFLQLKTEQRIITRKLIIQK